MALGQTGWGQWSGLEGTGLTSSWQRLGPGGGRFLARTDDRQETIWEGK